jgi:hypothetical protein
VSRGIEYPQFVTHTDDETLCLLPVGGFDLNPEELAGADRLDLLLETRLVYEVAQDGLALRVARPLLVGDDDIDRKGSFFGRNS